MRRPQGTRRAGAAIGFYFEEMSFFRTLGTSAQAMPKEERRSLVLAGRDVPLLIRTNPRARRLTLRIEPGGRGLRLTVPPRTRRRDIEAFLSRNEAWAAERIEALPTASKVGVGSLVPIAGEPHRIEHTGRLRGLPERIGSPGSDGPVLRVSGLEDRAGARVAGYLKAEARRAIEPAVARHTATIGRSAKAVRIKDTRSRWGSCTSDGALSFSWRLAMAPPPILDYLVAHEVAHLEHMNHGPDFWSLCRRLAPQTDEAKAWLKANGSALHAYEFG